MELPSSQRLTRLQTAELIFIELLKVVLVATVVIVMVRHFLFKPFRVEGASMVPSFHEREYLIIDELAYRLRAPERGEAIVFRYPLNPQTFYLKRIIGLPGERVSVEGGNIIIFNNEHPQGMVIREEYINAPKKT
jgi:signal peptidase I